MTIKKKFYVGSPSIIDGSKSNWPKETLAEAIEHAKELLEENDEEQIVVKIVAVIRRKESPIIVQKVD